jgi:hypothetical protein
MRIRKGNLLFRMRETVVEQPKQHKNVRIRKQAYQQQF